MFEKLGLHDLIRVLKFVKPRALSYYFGIISYSLTEASTFILIPIIIKFMLDAAIKGDMSILNRGEVLVGLVVVTSSFIFIGIIILFWSTVHRTVTDIKILSLRNVVRYPVSFFEKTHSGDLISRLTNDVNVLYGSLGMGLREILFICISGIGSAVVMIVLDWRFSIILLTVGIISTIVNAKFSSKIRDISDILQKSTGELTTKVSDMLAGVRIMKIFQIERTLENKFTDKNNEIQTLEFSRFKTSAALESTNFVIKWINFVGIIVIGALFSIQGKVDIGTVVAEIYLLGNVNNMISNVGSLLGALQGSLAGAARVMELLDMPAEVESYIAEESSTGEKMLEMKDVTFKYDEVPVLKGMNIAVEKGKVAALVGSSGGGKSTVIKLLMGFYPVTGGSLIIDGKSLGCYTLDKLRQMIAYVPQDAYIFAGTIEENIQIGRPDASYEEVVEAAKAAFAYEFIKEMPDGFKTIVGERGTGLSGGQKQRIAIARAVLKKAPILLLDEATASLDSQSEQQVQDALKVLMKGKTVLIIAHRLSTIEHADTIYVIDDGRVVESGTHKELLSSAGVYTKLYNLQFNDENREKNKGL